MRKKSKRILLYWCPAIFWMAVIFYFSSQTYHEQDMRPWLKDRVPESFVKKHLSDIKIYYDGSEISIRTKGVAGFLEFLIRKGAHLIEFAILGVLILIAINYSFGLHSWQKFLLAVLASFLYACSDEYHQMITGDRSPRLADVMIDTIGAVFGIGIFLLFKLILKRRTV